MAIHLSDPRACADKPSHLWGQRKPIDAATVEGVLSRQIDDLEPQLTRHGYDTKSVADQFDARPAEIRQLLRGGLDPARARELTDDMRAAGLPL